MSTMFWFVYEPPHILAFGKVQHIHTKTRVYTSSFFLYVWRKGFFFHDTNIGCLQLSNIMYSLSISHDAWQVKVDIMGFKKYRFQIERQFSSTLNFKILGKYRLSWFMRKACFLRYTFSTCPIVLRSIFPVFSPKTNMFNPLLCAYHH